MMKLMEYLFLLKKEFNIIKIWFKNSDFNYKLIST